MMKKILTSLSVMLSLSFALTLNCAASTDAYDLPDYTDAEREGIVVDLTDGEYLDDDEIDELDEYLDEVAETVGFNVGVVVTDYVPGTVQNYEGMGNYQEYQVEEYAYECFDILFGERDEADGVLLLINYYTLYDQIWADGEAEKYINDSRTQSIFDAIEPEMLNYDTYGEIKGFGEQVIRMYHKGNVKVSSAITGGFIGLIIGMIIALFTYFGTKKSYTTYPKSAAATYVDRSNTNFSDRQDTFIRQYTTRVRNSSSSGGGGGRSGGGGGRSGGGRGR